MYSRNQVINANRFKDAWNEFIPKIPITLKCKMERRSISLKQYLSENLLEKKI